MTSVLFILNELISGCFCTKQISSVTGFWTLSHVHIFLPARPAARPSMTAMTARVIPDSDDLSETQIDSIHLCNEDGGHGLVQSSAVHVDCGANRKYKARHSPVKTKILFKTPECDRQRGSAVDTIRTRTVKLWVKHDMSFKTVDSVPKAILSYFSSLYIIQLIKSKSR